MRRSLFILCAVAVASAGLCFGVYRLTVHWCAQHLVRSTDDLDWLRVEFRLNEAELSRIRKLHDGYLPQCQSFCERIASAKHELQATLVSSTNLSVATEQKLAEVGALRAQCQAAMLRHFFEVSRVMPPEQGRRYLAEMQRATLASHEQIEHRMSGDASTTHGHH